jgi:DNA-directed RNA polymerase II subunit RPB1
MATITAEWAGIDSGDGTNVTINITPEHAHQILRRISDQDVEFMGFSSNWARPEWMICQVMVVPPPAVRPSVKQGSGQRSDDDLTHILVDIIKTNNTIKDKIAQNANSKVIAGWVSVLQYYVAAMIDNNVSGMLQATQRSGRPMKSIKERLNGKTGRVRGNLMGKRVDYSSRSVITPDPNLSIRELGVPMKIAKNLTRPITVNDRNKAMLAKMVNNGPETYPGAKVVERATGEKISLRCVDRASIVIQNGDVVHRHMLDGDVVLFNRQPTLHRMSMMGHVAKIMYKGDTFRMNVADTKPYNADFDGDEMNMHLPQDDEAEMELAYLAAVPNHIISPANNKTIIGIFQDSLLGSYQFTRPSITFDARTAMNLMMLCKNIDANKIPKGKKITNFDIMSQIVPDMTIKYKLGGYDDEKDVYETSNKVMDIKNGKYIRGQLDKGALGGGGGKGLLQRVCNDFGNHASADFVDSLQNVVTEYMKLSAFSVGISDLIADETTNKEIAAKIQSQKSQVEDLIDQIHLGIMENSTGRSTAIEFETKVNAILNKASNEAGKIGKRSLAAGNRFVTMVNAGSKGSELNISQMISCLGQQNVDGKRIPYGYKGRTLPHFTKYDDSPAARGFVESSFVGGLSPTELFFHAQGGREGLIDTAVKTSTTGYISRRLIKSLEDAVVRYDMTVRNNKNKIIQFAYGEDHMDTVKIECQMLPLVEMSVTEIHSHYTVTDSLVNATKAAATRMKKQESEYAEKIHKRIGDAIEARDMIVNHVFGNLDDQRVYLPVAFRHIINNVAGQMGIRSNHKTDITPMEILELTDVGLERIFTNHHMERNRLFIAAYDFHLAPANLLERHKFNRKGVMMLVDTIVAAHMRAVIAPGETVGIVGAQSVGEPTTQMTLNTFHFAGVASKSNVTRGVPRIEEILSLTENPKNPSCEIALFKNEEHDKANVKRMIPLIENVSLGDLVEDTEICFDPDDMKTLIEVDRDLISQYKEFQHMIAECNGEDGNVATATPSSRSNWIMRIVLNEKALVESNVTVDDVYVAIHEKYGENISCVYADHNADKLIFRVRTDSLTKADGPSALDQSDEIYKLKKFQETMLAKVVLRGVNKITKATPRKIVGALTYDCNKEQAKNALTYDMDNGIYKANDRWVIDTVGTNLMDLLAMDTIDVSRTMTNDIQEVFKVLGVEAARQAILNELRDVIEFDGGYIDYHHMGLLCDRMTCNTSMVAVFRHGINNDDIGPLAKASFEETPEMFFRAARHGELDNMRGLSANVMTGQEGFFGTGAFSVVLDMAQMIQLKKDVKVVTETTIAEDFATSIAGGVDVADGCGVAQIGITNNVGVLAGTDMGAVDDAYDAGF